MLCYHFAINGGGGDERINPLLSQAPKFCAKEKSQMGKLAAISHKEYVRVLRPLLPEHFFKPLPHRLLWAVPHALVIIGSIAAVVSGWGGFVGKLLAAVLIGNSFASLGFLGHEIMHGAVVRKRWLRDLAAAVCFSPFWVGPTMWRLWHNVQHHVHTQHPDKDPDTSATYADYQRRPALQWLYRLVRRNGFLFLPMLSVWFTMHSSQMFWRLQRLADGPTRWVLWGERLIPFAAWSSLVFWLGISDFVWAYVLPLLIGNFIAMSYIATNHLLNPQMDETDPVVSTLTVTVPKWMDIVHLHFSHHTEHHLFPAMSSKYAPEVKRLVKALWPERYNEMPLWKALLLLWKTPRLYLDHDHLIDPVTKEVFGTLQRGLDPNHVEPLGRWE